MNTVSEKIIVFMCSFTGSLFMAEFVDFKQIQEQQFRYYQSPSDKTTHACGLVVLVVMGLTAL